MTAATLPSGEFLKGVIGRLAGTRLMAVLRVYFDESGTHKGSGALVVAGYLANDRLWDRFDTEWSNLLRREGLAAFHMTDCENLRGEFRGWDESRRRRVVQTVTAIIRRCTWFRIAAAVNLADYQSAASLLRDSLSPYSFCVNECLKRIRRWADERAVDSRIAYVFEQGSPFQGDVNDTMRMAMSDPGLKERYRIGSWVFSDKRDLLPLQAADVYAYECWKELTNRILVADPDQRRDRRKSLSELLRDKHGLFYSYADDLDKFAKEIEANRA